MAVNNYGAILKKNGKIINNTPFMDMEEAVGFNLEHIIYNGLKFGIQDNYFVYMGDKELLVCIYNTELVIISEEKIVKAYYNILNDIQCLKESGEIKQREEFSTNGGNFSIERMEHKNRAHLKLEYKGDTYECLYGYGVDFDIDSWLNLSDSERVYVEKFMNEQ